MPKFSEQLITSSIKQENPSLEERRHALLREHEEYREKLDGFQEKLLEDLGNSTGNMLEDEVKKMSCFYVAHQKISCF